jgi:hypothetical protein
VTGISNPFIVYPGTTSNCPTDYNIPTILRIGQQPLDVSELKPITIYPSLHLTNATGFPLTDVGNETHPWKVSVQLKGDPEGVTLEGVTEMPIIEGFANFTNIKISPEGKNYQLTFSVTEPDVSIPSVDSEIFDVSSRLAVKFEYIDTFVPNTEEFKANFKIWDKVNDVPASPDLLADQAWDCNCDAKTQKINIWQTITPRDPDPDQSTKTAKTKRDTHETITLVGDTNAAINKSILQLMTYFYHI